MPKVVVALLAIIAVAALSFDASAQSKKCKKGYVYDSNIGKCVSRRGSG